MPLLVMKTATVVYQAPQMKNWRNIITLSRVVSSAGAGAAARVAVEALAVALGALTVACAGRRRPRRSWELPDLDAPERDLVAVLLEPDVPALRQPVLGPRGELARRDPPLPIVVA